MDRITLRIMALLIFLLAIVVPSWCDPGKPLLNKDNLGHVKYYVCLELVRFSRKQTLRQD